MMRCICLEICTPLQLPTYGTTNTTSETCTVTTMGEHLRTDYDRVCMHSFQFHYTQSRQCSQESAFNRYMGKLRQYGSRN
jgi:hypothetical protein